MHEKRGSSLLYWRIFSIVLFVFLIIALVLPAFLSIEFISFSPDENLSFEENLSVMEIIGEDEKFFEGNASDEINESEERFGENVSFAENATKLNESLNDVNLTQNIDPMETTGSNETFRLLKNASVVDTISNRIVIGKPVRWTKKFKAEEDEIVRLPKEAENIIVKKEGAEVMLSPSEERVSLLDLLKELLSVFTGRAVAEEEMLEIVEDTDSKDIIIAEAAEYEIEFITPAPEVFEEKINEHKKRVIVSAPDLGYKDILTFTSIPEILPVGRENFIKIYWIEQDSPVSFFAYDSDENGLLDYVEWNTPYLSQQTFEIIIITKAEHLDSNRVFIEDVYEQVKARDENRLEISAGDYLRVTFEQNLTSSKDITVYARSAANGGIEVYEKDENELIADFGTIGEDKEYKIYLNNLIGEQETFDLLVTGGSVEFDYVVDPIAISDCGTLDIQDEVYNLNNDVASSGICFTITANNVTLNCNWNKISYSSLTGGIYSNGANFTSIRDCIIGGNGPAIAFNSVNNGSIINNNITTNFQDSPGIYLYGLANNTLIANNNLTLTASGGNLGDGIKINKNNYAYLANNTILMGGSDFPLSSTGINLSESIGSSIIGNIINTSDTNSKGVSVFSSENIALVENNISTHVDGGQGIIIDQSNNTLLQRNSIITFASNSGGILIFSGIDINLLNNNVSTYGSYGDGVIFSLSQNVTANGDFVLTRGSSAKGIALLDNSSSIILKEIYVRVIQANSNAFYIGAGENNFSIQDSILNASGKVFKDGKENSAKDIRINGRANGGMWNFTNVLGELGEVDLIWANGANGTLDLYWYLDAYANYTNGTAAIDINVSSWNNNSEIQFSTLTGSDGKIERQALREYTRNRTNVIYYSNYTFNATNSVGFKNLTNSWNITMNKELTFTFGDVISPIMLFALPTPPNASVVSPGPVEINVSIVEENLNEVKFNWNETNTTIYDSSLVLLMNFDNRSTLGENDTYVKDISMYGNDGIVKESVFWNSTGLYGGGYRFNGAGFIQLKDKAIKNSPNFTISLWFKTTITTRMDLYAESLGTGYSNINLNINEAGTGRLRMVWRPGSIYSISGTANRADGNWHHVVGMKKDKNFSIWEDGRIVNSINTLIGTMPDVSMASIGYFENLLTSKFNGIIDEVMIFNKSFTDAEIQQLYFMNLYKYDNEGYILYVNQSKNNTASLDIGNYTYFVYAKDKYGNENLTETRTVYVNDVIAPEINFTEPTPPNASLRDKVYPEINVSINEYESSLKEVKFNWNGENYTIYNDSLVLMFNFDKKAALGEDYSQACGKIKDLSNGNNDGYLSDSACSNANVPYWIASGRYGGAFSFNASDSKVVYVPSSPSLNNLARVTLSAWVYKDKEMMRDARIIAKEGAVDTAYGIQTEENLDLDKGKPKCEMNINGLKVQLATNPLPLHKWTYIVCTYDGSSMNIYVNGERANIPLPVSGAIEVSNNALAIGNKLPAVDRPFTGLIDEVRIWNSALSQEEVRELYMANLNKYDNDRWGLYIQQAKNSTAPLEFGNYTYFASAKDKYGNENLTETRWLLSALGIVDIDNLNYVNIAPGRMNEIKFSTYLFNSCGGACLGNVINASFYNGEIIRNDPACSYFGALGAILNYSCNVGIWYFDSPGEWKVNVSFIDGGNGYEGSREEIFNLMEEASISHYGILDYGSLMPGTTPNSIKDLLVNNTGNVAFSEISIKGNNLLKDNVGPQSIFASEFRVGDILGSACSATQMSSGNSLLIPGASLPVGNNSKMTRDSSSGQEELFVCLTQIPGGLPAGNYRAGGINSWELTAV